MSVSDASQPASAVVVAAVVAVEGVPIGTTVEAIRRQAYGVERMVLIGGDEGQRSTMAAMGMEQKTSLEDLAASLEGSVDLVWVVHGDAEPRPDALTALVSETIRSDAAVVGSKILDAAIRDRLESVGEATDVFGEQYTGLDLEEVDLEQYDVVRDVAYVSAVSMLIRRDLLRGLQGGDSLLAPAVTGMDLSQRARLAGARVMVVPSSEVFHTRECGHHVATWREQASRLRSMFKAYRLITLMWVVPVGFIVAIFDGLVRLAFRQVRPMADYLRALAWNIYRMPSTISARRTLGLVRVTRDEELFRYQVAGSLRIRNLATDLGERLGWIIDREPGIVTEEEVADDSKVSSYLVGGVSVLMVLAIARGLIFGSAPAGGMSLPLSADPWAVLRSYAGGWNATGLGTPESVQPVVAWLSMLQGLSAGWVGVGGLLTAISLVTAVWGVGRLLGNWGVAGPSRYLGGVVAVAGPLMTVIGSTGWWIPVLALGPLVWACVWVISPGGRILGWVGRLAVAGVAISAGGWALVLVVPITVAVAAFAGLRVPPRTVFGSLLVVGASALASAPYLVALEPRMLIDGGLAMSISSQVVVAGLALVALGISVCAERASRVVALGGLMAVIGVGVGWFPAGGIESQIAGLCLGSLGMGLAVAGVFSVDENSSGTRKAAQLVAALLGIVVLGMASTGVVDGSLGVVDSGWGDRLVFVEALSDDPTNERVLVIGDRALIPGEVRTAPGFAYRLVNGSKFSFDQAFLPAPRAGDRQLDKTVGAVFGGGSLHPGSELASFAIRWVVLVGAESPGAVFDTQVDMREVSLAPGVRVFENLAFEPRFAAKGWKVGRDGGSGPATKAIRLADNFDQGWGAAHDDWAMIADGSDGLVRFGPDPLRRGLALATLFVLFGGWAAILFGRERR